MIILKNRDEIDKMKKAGEVIKRLFEEIDKMDIIKIGTTTKSIDIFIGNYIKNSSAVPSFLNYRGFPANSCISINDTVVHGIPDDYTLAESDIVSVDVGVYKNGYHADAARTYIVNEAKSEIVRFVETATESFFEGVKMCVPDKRIGDISNNVQKYVESHGFNVIRDFYGHGIGRDLHEDPIIPNYGKPNRGARIKYGMTLAIEPMISMGSPNVKVMEDGWTAKTIDGSLAAHYENTVAITANGPIILTL
jgi:methionyl aminopeptidase